MEYEKINMGSGSTERKKKVKQFSIDYLLNLTTPSTTTKRVSSSQDEDVVKSSKIQKPIPEYIQPFPMRTPSEDLSRVKFLPSTSPRERYTDELEAPSPTDLLNSRKRGPETIGKTNIFKYLFDLLSSYPARKLEIRLLWMLALLGSFFKLLF